MSAHTPTLPKGVRLLHIGPPKTGTSALQSACHACRSAMKAEGVHYAGAAKQAATAAYAVTHRVHPSTGKAPGMRHWDSLVREVRGARESRVFVSSEFFAGASPEQIAHIVRDLDPQRLHVAVTLRPLAKILASRWQQNVQEGARIPYEAWLHDVLELPESDHGKRFWSRQRHDALIRRWADAVGANRVTAVLVDESDHDALLRTFEQLLGMASGTLVAQRDAANRSMTRDEIEAVRSFNEQFFGNHFSKALHYKLMSRGAALHMKSRNPSPDEERLLTPQWAIDMANQYSSEIASSMQTLGINFVGDPAQLVVTPSLATIQTAQAPGHPVSSEVAARMAMGVLLASGRARGERGNGKGRLGPAWSEPEVLFRVSTVELFGAALRRIWSGGVEKVAGLFARRQTPRR